jgi:hypothetical protein
MRKPGRYGGATARAGGFDVARITIAGLIGILLVVILALDVFGDADHSAPRSAESSGEVTTLTEYELLSRAGTIEPPAYWIGRRPGVDHFELEKEADGNLYVRYLTGNAPAGSRRSDSLTVASYPLAEARQSLERAAQAEREAFSHHDGFVMLGSNDSYGAYVVFDDLPELQIEIYSPRRGEAAKLAVSGALTPLHWTPLG